MRTAIAVFCAVAVFFSLDGAILSGDALAEKARTGDADSQYRLAIEYFFGRSRTVNPVLAVYWFRRAADAGHPEAQYNLARCYERGWGARRSMGMAVKYYSLAKEQKILPAVLRYAELLYAGVPPEKSEYGEFKALKADRNAALQLMREAAKTSDAGKLVLVKHLFHDAPQHGAELRMRLKNHVALPNAHPEMLLLYSSCLRSGIGGEVDLVEGTAVLKRAADAGNMEAVAQLAEVMELGIGVKYDPVKAFELTRTAAQKGNPRALLNLGNAFLAGVNVEYSPETAVKYFKQAADTGYPPALCKLGDCYARGIGIGQNWTEAIELYRAAAEAGNEDAHCILGDCYDTGSGVQRNETQAFYHYSMAAERGSIKAIRKMGIFLLDGRGVRKDTARGMELLKKAAQAGDQTAQYILGKRQRSL